MNLNADKEEFLKEFGDDYGYPNAPKRIDDIRASEFKRLNDSQSDSSSATSDIIREARQQVLDYFKASPKEYKCIFTSGATGALKLVGECFPWSSQSNFMYTMENHNSVLGIREYALSKGAAAFAIEIEEAADSIKVLQHSIQRRGDASSKEEEAIGTTYNLFAFPSECNFSGVRYSVDLFKNIKENSARSEGLPVDKGHWMVLIDAAKGCTTKPPDLSKYCADFVVISFYKLFGYPTGLGALIVRNEAAKLLKTTYFSGGTVAATIADIDFVKRREGIEELLEDGTSSFLSIASIHHGFRILNTLTLSAISRHTASLATYLRRKLLNLRHENGASVCTIYGIFNTKVCHQLGPIVCFNLKRPDGTWFGYREVEKLASLSGIQLRTGCFCNPGACAKYLGLSHLDLLSNVEAGHVCWDDYDIVNGKPTGAVRVSFGYMSTFEDAKKFIDFIVSSFVSAPKLTEGLCLLGRRATPFSNEGLEGGLRLKTISIYPIKSCAGFTAESWPLCSTGLKHDREWLLKSLSGEILTQKKVPEMGLISAFIDLNRGILFVESKRCKGKLKINLKTDSYDGEREEMGLHLHTQRYEVHGCGNEVNTWFSSAIGRPCSLLRHYPRQYHFCANKSDTISTCRDVQSKLNFVNEAQFLLISEASLFDLNDRLSLNVHKGNRGTPTLVNSVRFRPNLVLSGGKPYAEDTWKRIKIGNNCFTSLGGCNRCQMINFDLRTGQVQKSNEPLATLASYRRVKGKILFGVLLRYETDANNVGQDQDSWLKVGEEVIPTSF